MRIAGGGGEAGCVGRRNNYLITMELLAGIVGTVGKPHRLFLQIDYFCIQQKSRSAEWEPRMTIFLLDGVSDDAILQTLWI